tara:strand:- start:115 stop:855 length:741 start_codon:yes stop_codon:yes gene_type:complete
MNKTILVTGASGKIGSQIIKELIDKNFCVIGTYLKKKIKLKKKFLNQKIFTKKFDQSKISDVKKLINFIAKENLDLRGVVNCAVLRPMKKGSNDSLQNWEKSIKVNSNAVYLLNDLFCKFFKKKKFGRIINIGSIYGSIGPDFNLYKSENFELEPDYIYNKFGMIGLTKYFASKYGKENITINTISPGGILANQSKSFIFKYSKKTFLKRMANKNEIFGLVEYILSDKSNYLTGQNIILDGGYTSN